MNLSKRDEARLVGVHPHLVRVVRRAAQMSEMPFTVLEGTRTVARQRQLVAKGASKTMNSRHIPAPNGYGHAVDIAPVDAAGTVSWDWPLYHRLAPVMKAAARAEGVPLEWGGDWKRFKDGPHWQLPWKAYPGAAAEVAAAAPMAERAEGDLAGSRTLAGAGTTGFGILGSVASETAGQIEGLSYYSETLRWLFIGLSIVGIAAVVHARLDDAGRLPKWLGGRAR